MYAETFNMLLLMNEKVSAVKFSVKKFSTMNDISMIILQEGGPIGLIQNGDVINIDVQNRRIDVLVSDEEMEARRKKWTTPAYKANQGVLYKV